MKRQRAAVCQAGRPRVSSVDALQKIDEVELVGRLPSLFPEGNMRFQ